MLARRLICKVRLANRQVCPANRGQCRDAPHPIGPAKKISIFRRKIFKKEPQILNDNSPVVTHIAGQTND